VQIEGVIALTDRNHKPEYGGSVEEALRACDVPYHSMSSALRLLPQAYKRMKPSKDIARRVEEEFEKYGTGRLNLIS